MDETVSTVIAGADVTAVQGLFTSAIAQFSTPVLAVLGAGLGIFFLILLFTVIKRTTGKAVK